MSNAQSTTTAAAERDGGGLVDFIYTYGPYLILLTAVVATLGSLYFSEIRHFEPCRLCWFQRIFMYPLALISLVGVIRRDDYFTDYVIPLAVIGFGIALYQVLMQNGIVAASDTCSTVSCAGRYVNYFGFITIPLMSMTAFTIILITSGSVRWANAQYDD